MKVKEFIKKIRDHLIHEDFPIKYLIYPICITLRKMIYISLSFLNFLLYADVLLNFFLKKMINYIS